MAEDRVAMSRPVTFFFTTRALVAIISIELGSTLGGAGAAVLVIFGTPTLDVRFRAVLASMALGLAGSGAYYLRRIYRAAFDGRLELTTSSERRSERIGTTIYLIGRPAISVAMTLAVALGVILSYTSVAPSSAVPTADLIYLSGSLGFVTGFLGGRVIEQLETTGKF